MKLLTKPVEYWRTKRKIWKIWSTPSATAIRNLCSRRYWTRLWVYQEIKLASELQVICGSQTIQWTPFASFLDRLREADHSEETLPSTRRVRDDIEYRNVIDSAAMSIAGKTDNNAGTFMVHMRITCHLQCAVSCDRVYALLGVVEQGASKITADYTMPLPSLLNLVLREQHRLTPPTRVEDVVEDCAWLERLFALEEGCMFQHKGQQGFTPPPSKDLLDFVPGSGCKIPLWWCEFYGHDAVLALLFDHQWILPEDFISAVQAGACALTESLLRPGRISALDVPVAISTAVLWGKADMLRQLLTSEKFDINWKDEKKFKRTALQIAAMRGDEAMVSILLGFQDKLMDSRNPSHPDMSNRTLTNGDSDTTGAVSRCDTLATDGLGRTAMHCAAFRRDETSWHDNDVTPTQHPRYDRVLERLVEADPKGARKTIMMRGYNGESPIHALISQWNIPRQPAQRYGEEHKKMLGTLLELANEETLRIGGQKGATVLHYAARCGSAYVAKVLVTRSKSLIDLEDDSCRTQTHYAIDNVQDFNVEVYAAGESINEFLDLLPTADFNKPDDKGRTPLHLAAIAGNLSGLKSLLDSGRTELEAHDIRGLTPFLCAVKTNRAACAALLLARGADVRAKDKSGVTARSLVTTASSLEMPLLLSTFDPWFDQLLLGTPDGIDSRSFVSRWKFLELLLQVQLDEYERESIVPGEPYMTYSLPSEKALYKINRCSSTEKYPRGLPCLVSWIPLVVARRHDVKALLGRARASLDPSKLRLHRSPDLLRDLEAVKFEDICSSQGFVSWTKENSLSWGRYWQAIASYQKTLYSLDPNRASSLASDVDHLNAVVDRLAFQPSEGWFPHIDYSSFPLHGSKFYPPDVDWASVLRLPPMSLWLPELELPPVSLHDGESDADRTGPPLTSDCVFLPDPLVPRNDPCDLPEYLYYQPLAKWFQDPQSPAYGLNLGSGKEFWKLIDESDPEHLDTFGGMLVDPFNFCLLCKHWLLEPKNVRDTLGQLPEEEPYSLNTDLFWDLEEGQLD